MAILSEEAKERIRKRRLAGDFKPKDTFVPTPEDPSSINILGDVAGTMWRGIERAGRLAGLGVGTVAAAPMSLLNLAPIKAVRDWAPDIQDIGECMEPGIQGGDNPPNRRAPPVLLGIDETGLGNPTFVTLK